MTRHEAHDGAQRAQKERRSPRHRPRQARPQTAARGAWRCARCGSTGDPRTCVCMRQIRRRLDDARTHLRAGRPSMGETELAQASQLLNLLQKDAIKASGRDTGG